MIKGINEEYHRDIKPVQPSNLDLTGGYFVPTYLLGKVSKRANNRLGLKALWRIVSGGRNDLERVYPF
jgi:hypothetical protein